MGSMGELAGLIAAFTWSFTSAILTSLSAHTSSSALSAVRLCIASAALVGVAAVSGHFGALEAAPTAALLQVAASGLVGYGIGDTLYIHALSVLGMQRVFPSSLAIFLSLTVIGGVALLDEPFTWGLPLGAALIGLGVYLLVIPARARLARPIPVPATPEAAAVVSPVDPEPVPLDPPTGGRRPALQGYAALLMTGLCWATATLWLAAAPGDLDALSAALLRAPAGAAGLLLFVLATRPHDLAAPFTNPKYAGGILLAGLIGSGLGGLLYIYSVVEAGAARAALLSATSPLMALPLSVFLLHEPFTGRRAAGTALCVLGIILVVS